MADLDAALTGPAPLVGSPTAVGARSRALVLEHYEFIWRLLSRLGVPRAEAEDATQQVFIVASQRLGDIPPGRERTFLYGTAGALDALIARLTGNHSPALNFLSTPTGVVLAEITYFTPFVVRPLLAAFA